MSKDVKDDFYDDVNLVSDEDIVEVKKKKTPKPVKMSHSHKKNNYEKVSAEKEINKEEILQGEPMIEKQEEEFLVQYEFVEEKEPPKEIKTTHPPYIGYTPRLILCIVLVPILSLLAIYFLYHSYEVEDLVNIRYTEQGVITPKEIGEKEINLDINYAFKINQESNLTFKYQLSGNLVLLDKENEEKILYQESIPFDKNQEKILKQGTKKSFRQSISLLMNEYEEKVTQYREQYNVETINYVEISLLVDYQSNPGNTYYLKDKSNTSIQIPVLSPGEEITYNNLDVEKRVNTKPTVKVQSVGMFGLGILMSIGAVLSLTWTLILIYSTMNEKSLYDKTIDKILKKHKNRITTVQKVPRKRGKQVLEMYSIKDLVKISKKLKIPIKYCVIHEHSKSQFFIENKKELYIYTLKEVDLEKED